MSDYNFSEYWIYHGYIMRDITRLMDLKNVYNELKIIIIRVRYRKLRSMTF